MPVDRLGELALAVAAHRRSARTSPARTVERDAAQRFVAAVARGQSPSTTSTGAPTGGPRAARCPARPLARPSARRASAASRPRRRRSRRLPAAQHRDAVGHRLHLVQLVRDEDDRAALRQPSRAASRRATPTPAASARRSARRGSGCAPRGRAPSGSRRAAARRARAARSAPAGRPRCGSARRARRPGARSRADGRELRPSPRWSPRITFSATVNGGNEPEVLVHHADPRVERLARRGESDVVPADQDLALVRAGRGPVRMFESVDLPAPFSPSSACTSPSAASKSTPSFATTPGTAS